MSRSITKMTVESNTEEVAHWLYYHKDAHKLDLES